MYYEEKMIGSKFCYRTLPDGKWHPYSYAQVVERYLAVKKEINELRREKESFPVGARLEVDGSQS